LIDRGTAPIVVAMRILGRLAIMARAAQTMSRGALAAPLTSR
jgi:hypothetical protein